MNKPYETDTLEDSEPDFFRDEENGEDDGAGRKPKKQKKFSLLILIFSFVIATAVWLYVESTEEQGYEKVINLVPVDIVGIQELERNNNMSVISGYDNTVNVTLVGKRSDVNKYSAKDIYAYVDVSKINSSERQMLTVQVDSLPDVSVTVVSPTDIAVYADVIGSREIDVVVNPYYTIDGSYFIDESAITKSVQSVTVTGPVSVLDTIRSATAAPDLGKLTGSVKSNTRIELIDDKGNKINNPYIKTDVDVIEIYIPVHLKKYVELYCKYNEADFEGYDVSISLDYKALLISGEVLNVTPIERVAVTLTKSDLVYENGELKPAFTINMPINLPAGVKNEGELTSVAITVTVTKKQVQNDRAETTAPAPAETTAPETTSPAPSTTEEPAEITSPETTPASPV